MRGLETRFLYRVIREEPQEHSVTTGNDWRWLFAPTKASETGRSAILAVIYLQVVVCTLLMSLHVNLFKSLWERIQFGLITIQTELVEWFTSVYGIFNQSFCQAE